MGSTLEHGIYLPSEGEKNCYQGLAGNWNKVDGALGDIAELKQSIESKFTKEIVTELPTEDINPFCIYMILKTDPETDNVYDEWVYINNAWEYLGNTKVDMTQYYTKQEVNELPAVASGVTATKVGNYDAHIANGDIHVTASDKTKWTNSANTHVLRLAKSALTPSTSDNSFSNLDDSTTLKVGDKVMDTAGVLFEVTAIDTQNSTFTIGTALIDLAQDSDVVHKSRDETITGVKTFTNDVIVYNSDNTANTPNLNLRNYRLDRGTTDTGVQTITFLDKNDKALTSIESRKISNGNTATNIFCYNNDDSNNTVSGGVSIIKGKTDTNFAPSADNAVTCGRALARWSKIYGTEYYYGSNNVEFSTKFVTTDTAQTIVGKEFISDLFFTSDGILDVSGGRIASIYRDTNKKEVARLTGGVQSSGRSLLEMTVRDIFNNEFQTCGFGLRFQSSSVYGLIPITDNTHIIGTNNVKLKSINTNQINNLEPSSLSLPSGNASNFIDISSYFANTGTGETNSYTASANGWIYLRLGDISSCQATIYDSNNNRMWGQSSTGSVEQMTIPILKGQTLSIQWNTSSTVNVANARFIPCQGNV